MPALDAASQSTTVSIAGHTYTPAQVRHALRAGGVLLAFAVFSYLALVTLPRLAARRAIPPATTRAVATAPAPPFAARTGTHPMARRPPPAHRRPAAASAPLPPRKLAPAPSHALKPPPPHWRSTPAAWATTARLHSTADALVGAHPTAVPLAARVPVAISPQKTFPWIPANGRAAFGIVRARPRSKTLPTPRTNATSSSNAHGKPLAQAPRPRMNAALFLKDNHGLEHNVSKAYLSALAKKNGNTTLGAKSVPANGRNGKENACANPNAGRGKNGSKNTPAVKGLA
ncbi:hypothetical protein FB451DRAFT_1524545 [Mycena latifolia]|nr:hypothetical protein FB451DRAFT_1524545 [Mycena latifolia]